MGSDDYFLMSRMEIFSTLYTYKGQKANKMGEKENSSLQEGSFYGSLWTARSRALVPIPQWLPQSSASAGGTYMSHLLNVEPDIPQIEVVRSVFCQ
ncbi:MAG TPA: hypothetical protein VKB04_03705, partial [Anaerolineales bacterium]|nr:hypothetical protein [Anaerolineales bacterium]